MSPFLGLLRTRFLKRRGTLNHFFGSLPMSRTALTVGQSARMKPHCLGKTRPGRHALNQQRPGKSERCAVNLAAAKLDGGR
jgi:hypothetical protein